LQWMQKKSFTLKQLVFLSWLAPALLTLFASFSVFFFLGWLDFQNNVDITSSDLSQKSKVVARRLAAEIMLEESGSIDAVSRKLIEELHISDLGIEKSAKCVLISDQCVWKNAGRLVMYRQIPHISEQRFVVLSMEMKTFLSFLNPKYLLWSALPVLLLIALGLFFQLLFLRKHIIEPVSSLVSAAVNEIEVQDSWPIELKQIGLNLSESFKAREQAVFTMLAKGVIHDIKTFLHSLLIAVDLINESEGDKRNTRLEKLYEACKISLPKMKRIIELTLDGSQEIPIRPVEANLINTIKGAVDANIAYARERGVVIATSESSSSIILAHDPIQLERALANLIKNGIEAVFLADGKGRKENKVLVEITDSPSGDLEITVEDSGLGFDLEKKSSFIPVKSKKAHGAGLGLYITEKIITGHHGRLCALHSSLLGGAKLSVSLPKGRVV